MFGKNGGRIRCMWDHPLRRSNWGDSEDRHDEVRENVRIDENIVQTKKETYMQWRNNIKGKVCIRGKCLFRKINVCPLLSMFSIPHLNSHLLLLRCCNVLGVCHRILWIRFLDHFVENSQVPCHCSICSDTGGSSTWCGWGCRIGSNEVAFASWDWGWIVRLVEMRMEWVEFII